MDIGRDERKVGNLHRRRITERRLQKQGRINLLASSLPATGTLVIAAHSWPTAIRIASEIVIGVIGPSTLAVCRAATTLTVMSITLASAVMAVAPTVSVL